MLFVLVHCLPEPGGRGGPEHFLELAHDLGDRHLGGGLHRVDLPGNQLGRSRSADLHGIDDGAAGNGCCTRCDPVLLVLGRGDGADGWQLHGLVRADLPDVKTGALAEVLIDHLAVRAGKCYFHGDPFLQHKRRRHPGDARRLCRTGNECRCKSTACAKMQLPEIASQQEACP